MRCAALPTTSPIRLGLSILVPLVLLVACSGGTTEGVLQPLQQAQ